MFRAIKIVDIDDNVLDENSLIVKDAFFFTINVPNYYLIYNKKSEIIGTVPMGYNMFFKVDESETFEDINIENVMRLYDSNIKFSIMGVKEDSHKVILIDSSEISKFELVEDADFKIPFTNQAFDSDGIIVFKNMNTLVDSIENQ